MPAVTAPQLDLDGLVEPADARAVAIADPRPPREAADTDPRPIVAVDWAHNGMHVTFDGADVETVATFEELLALLDRPHRIVTESTFESWDPDRRIRLAAEARDAGHEVLVFRPKHTAKHRPDHMDKTHANDARVIHALATRSPLHIYPMPDPDPEWAAFREEANHEYNRLRLTDGKAALAAKAAEALGPYKQLPPDAQDALGNGSRYYPALLAAMWFAASKTTSRARFERLLGLHGSAYPTLLRSEVHQHAYRWIRRRGVDMTTFRREIRRARRVIVSHQQAARPGSE